MMKMLKLSMAAAAATWVVGTTAFARGNDVADGVYIFTATDGNTALNGSTLKFQNDQIVSWDLIDSLVDIVQGKTGFPGDPGDPLTPANSVYVNTGYDGVFGPDAWSFSFASDSKDPYGNYAGFSGQNNLEGNLGGGSVGTLGDTYGDPVGNWNLAPDASSTFQLLAGALTVLGTCRSFLRGRATERR